MVRGQEISASISSEVELSANLMRGRDVGRFGKEYITHNPKVGESKDLNLFSFKKGPNDVFMTPGTISKHKSIAPSTPSLLPERRTAILSTRGNILLTCIDPLHCQGTRLHLD